MSHSHTAQLNAALADHTKEGGFIRPLMQGVWSGIRTTGKRLASKPMALSQRSKAWSARNAGNTTLAAQHGRRADAIERLARRKSDGVFRAPSNLQGAARIGHRIGRIGSTATVGTAAGFIPWHFSEQLGKGYALGSEHGQNQIKQHGVDAMNQSLDAWEQMPAAQRFAMASNPMGMYEWQAAMNEREGAPNLMHDIYNRAYDPAYREAQGGFWGQNFRGIAQQFNPTRTWGGLATMVPYVNRIPTVKGWSDRAVRDISGDYVANRARNTIADQIREQIDRALPVKSASFLEKRALTPLLSRLLPQAGRWGARRAARAGANAAGKRWGLMGYGGGMAALGGGVGYATGWLDRAPLGRAGAGAAMSSIWGRLPAWKRYMGAAFPTAMKMEMQSRINRMNQTPGAGAAIKPPATPA